jgi:hypothetical protein
MKLRTVSGEPDEARTWTPSSVPESKFQSRREQVPSLHFGSPFLHTRPHALPSQVGTVRSPVEGQLAQVGPQVVVLVMSLHTPLQQVLFPPQGADAFESGPTMIGRHRPTELGRLQA